MKLRGGKLKGKQKNSHGSNKEDLNSLQYSRGHVGKRVTQSGISNITMVILQRIQIKPKNSQRNRLSPKFEMSQQDSVIWEKIW